MVVGVVVVVGIVSVNVGVVDGAGPALGVVVCVVSVPVRVVVCGVDWVDWLCVVLVWFVVVVVLVGVWFPGPVECRRPTTPPNW